MKCPIVDIAGLKRLSHLRQPVAHRHRIPQIAGPIATLHCNAAATCAAPPPPTHRSPNQAAHRTRGTATREAHRWPLAAGRQPPPRSASPAHPIQQCHGLRRRLRRIPILEHTFDSSRNHRRHSRRAYRLKRESTSATTESIGTDTCSPVMRSFTATVLASISRSPRTRAMRAPERSAARIAPLSPRSP